MAEEYEYKEYMGKQVKLLVDARAYDTRGYSSDTNCSLSLELTAKIVAETDAHIDLEDVIINNRGSLCQEGMARGHFRKARINKDYLIGVFEE